ncbi:methylated-DNA--protein-cysteine methyltransferase [Arenicella chitinivorans]|uniref:Methylated-DNA--protein-cysteine methyltransferase n=1 Tax=Arenicella chitinivorans TaxID=1329800 RepID=A0A918VIE8_9GAMM|nr:methylated-DNA--[protein]-cysteine S-methyltransferase [Arenicella chitinivorans]GGZ98672.1 methylated-DNA--protein-cysteine methyltransferase [Arenicella chitinivorans]
MHFHDTLETPLGQILLAATAQGLSSVVFTERVPDGRPNTITDRAKRQLRAYFDGDVRDFSVPLDVAGTAFQKQVWRALATIEYGRTCAYRDIAEQIGNPKAVRAVGLANGKNPVAIIVPCHRVIGADGSLTGYASGVDRKAWLLKHEQAQ